MPLINLMTTIYFTNHQFSKWGLHRQRCFKKFENKKIAQKNNVLLNRYDKKCLRSVNCYSHANRYMYVKFSQRD